jgi:hypothetical protein
MRLVLAAMFSSACGRIGFDTGGDAAADAMSCTSDADCGPCAACETNVCVAQTVAQLYLGHRNTCFIGTNGSRWCSGEGSGLGGADPTFPSRIAGDDGWTSLSPGWYASYGARNGAIWVWAYQQAPTLQDSDGTWVQIATELSRACFRHAAGDVRCDGTSETGTWLDVRVGQTSTNDYGDCGIQSDHTLWCWGADEANMLGHGVEPDGTIVANPLQVGTANDWQQVAIGDRLACALKLDGTVWCWGDPMETGTNMVDTQGVPTQISPRTDWAWVNVRWQHACAGTATNYVECWGQEGSGNVLPGQRSVLVPTAMTPTWDQLLMGGHHYCGLAGGQWYCWGWNAAGQLAIGTTTSQQSATVPVCTQGT